MKILPDFRKFVLYLILLFFITIPVYAKEQINSFDARYLISGDGTVRVEENIEYEFSNVYKHGIFREIPYNYKINGNNYNLAIDVDSVTDFNGNPYKFSVKRNNGVLNIRIGDPDKTITGIHGYRIVYFVRRVVQFEEKEDIFYWNITGNEWKVPILKSIARIYFEHPGIEHIKTECFSGSYGSKAKNCNITTTGNGIRITAENELWAGDGLTVMLHMPVGMVKEPSGIVKIFYFLRDNFYYSYPFITLLIIGFLWYYRGRDPNSKRPLTVRYSPPDDMTPAQAGVLYDERADIIDLTSTIIDLAVRGYLRIEEIKTTKLLFFTDRDYRLVRLDKEAGEKLNDFEIKTLNGLFVGDGKEVLVSELKDRFYRNLDSIKRSLYSSLVRKKYFLSSPERMRYIYKVAGICVIFGGVFLFPSLMGKLMMALSGLIIIVLSRFMPRKTRNGAETYYHLRGFREFINRAEKERIKLLAKEDPTLFERMLPFALVFGLEEKWAEAFSDIFTEPPNWYVSPGYGNTFNSYIFVNEIGRSIGVLNKSLYSSPANSSGGRSISMSGGGFSGGGFGGGGGGSW